MSNRKWRVRRSRDQWAAPWSAINATGTIRVCFDTYAEAIWFATRSARHDMIRGGWLP